MFSLYSFLGRRPRSQEITDAMLASNLLKRFTDRVSGVWDQDGPGTSRTGLAGIDAAGEILATDLSATYALAYSPKVGVTAWAAWGLTGDTLGWVQIGGAAQNFVLSCDGSVAPGSRSGYELMFGRATASGKFHCLAFTLSGSTTWSADGGVWEYPTAADGSAWAAFPAADIYDTTNDAVHTGKRPFKRSGSVLFRPQADHVALAANVTLNGHEVGNGAGWFVRFRITDGTTSSGQTGGHDSAGYTGKFLTPTYPLIVPRTSNIATLRVRDGAATVHTTADVKFFFMNFTTGDPSALFTWPQDYRSYQWTDLDWDLIGGEAIWPVIMQEDGAAEPANVALEFVEELVGAAF